MSNLHIEIKPRPDLVSAKVASRSMGGTWTHAPSPKQIGATFWKWKLIFFYEIDADRTSIQALPRIF